MQQWKSNQYCIFWACICSCRYKAINMLKIVVCGLPGCTIFFQIIS